MGQPKISTFLLQMRHDVEMSARKARNRLSGIPEDQREVKIEELLPTRGLIEVRLRVPRPLIWVEQLREKYTKPIAQKRFWDTRLFYGELLDRAFIGESLNEFLVAALDIVKEAEAGKISLQMGSHRHTLLHLWRQSHKCKDDNFQRAILDLIEWYINEKKAIQHLKALGIRMQPEVA